MSRRVPSLCEGEEEGEGVVTLVDRTPHLYPLPFSKGRGGEICHGLVNVGANGI